MTASDPIDLLSRALDQTGAVIAGVRPEQSGSATPCGAWDVRTLVNHTVQDVQQFAVMAGGGAWEQREGDAIGDDWPGAYRAAADGLLEAWRQPGALEQPVQLPGGGSLPGTWRLGQQTANMAVHGWDIAKATGQSTDLDPEVGRRALDWGHQNLRPQFRGDETSGKAFGLEVPVPDDAPVYDRLAGFFGRDPG